MTIASEISVLESVFPHIIAELMRRWHDGSAAAYLDSLVIDSRGGRGGFPAEAMSELMFLAELDWWRHHDASEAGSIAPESFSFGKP